jgi:hypothetical protein
MKTSNYRSIGKWILPQPKNKKEYVEIPKIKSQIPFGYKLSEREGWLAPIPLELNALEEAKKYLKQYSFADVSEWLSAKTGRYISPGGLRLRVKSEQLYGKRYHIYQSLARRYKEALEKAEEYEKKLGNTGGHNYFDSEEYRILKATFGIVSKFK